MSQASLQPFLQTFLVSEKSCMTLSDSKNPTAF